MKRLIKQISEFTLIKNIIIFFLKFFCSKRNKISYEESISEIYSLCAPKKCTSLCAERRFNKNLDLTIIVPVYNSEKFVYKCLMSILNQKTKYSFELLVIDDGSTDNSREIIQHINDSRLKFCVQKNMGVSSARNRCLSEANGRYVMFVDSDDYIFPNSIDLLMNIAIKYNADGVKGNVVHPNEKPKLNAVPISVNAKIQFSGYPVAGVYKIDFFKNIEFPIGMYYEDSIMRHMIFPQMKTAFYIDYDVYFYNSNPNSICSKAKTSLKIFDTLWVTNGLIDDQKAIGIKQIINDYDFSKMFLRQMIINSIRLDSYNPNVGLFCVAYCNKLIKENKIIAPKEYYWKTLYNCFENCDLKLMKKVFKLSDI